MHNEIQIAGKMAIPADWSFRTQWVADEFDDHVREQLPWYDLVAGATAHIARHYLRENALCYDVGASTGNMFHLLENVVSARDVDYHCIEQSPQMARILMDTIGDKTSVHEADALQFEFQKYDVCILFLVYMFLPVPFRRAWLNSLLNNMNQGGCLILVDKIQPPRGYLGTIMRRLTLAGKEATGTPSDKIIEKELSLAGVQRPIDEAEFVNFSKAPYKFFAFGEFAGWVFEDTVYK